MVKAATDTSRAQASSAQPSNAYPYLPVIHNSSTRFQTEKSRPSLRLVKVPAIRVVEHKTRIKEDFKFHHSTYTTIKLKDQLYLIRIR